MMVYQNPEPIDRNVAEKLFQTGSDEEICDALLSITFYNEDWKWVQSKCLYYLNHQNPSLRGVAAICLGHIARIHHKLDKELVINALLDRMKDTEIAGSVQDALDDIEMFL